MVSQGQERKERGGNVGRRAEEVSAAEFFPDAERDQMKEAAASPSERLVDK